MSKLTTLLFVTICPFLIHADVPLGNEEDSKVSLYGYIDFEAGQIVKGRFQDKQYRHLWLENIHGRFGLQYRPFDRLAMRCGAEIRVWYNTFPESEQSDWSNGMAKYFSTYLHEAQGIFTLLDGEALGMELSLGYFPYKYNPEVHDLGEYLFRSGTYPAYLVNSFDMPTARLSGIRYSLNYGSDIFGVTFDQLILTEQQIRPFHDFTLASIFDVHLLKKMVSLGAGVSFAHLFSVDDSITSPKVSENLYIEDGDSLYYTFKGTKLMFRTTLDPFGAFRGQDGFMGNLVGADGGKIYGELAILGVKDYPNNLILDSVNCSNPYGYDDIKGKMPMMFGINIPFWKILDVCALEFEFFDCPYQNDFVRVQQYGYPLPDNIRPDTTMQYDPETYENDNWKWSIFLKKDLNKHFGMIVQLCRNHQRWEWSGFQGLSFDYEEALVKKGEWAWHCKTEFKF